MSAIREYLDSMGIDPKRILATTWDDEGYNEIRFDWKTGQPAKNKDGIIMTRRKAWPEGFSARALRDAMLSDGLRDR